MTAAALDNTGGIQLEAPANQALLDVTGSAGFGTGGVLSGDVQLSGDSAIEFKGGQISTIAAGSGLTLYGPNAFIEDSTALGSNSALTGLSNVAGSLVLENGASVLTPGPLAISGYVLLNSSTSSLSSSKVAATALTNTGTIILGLGALDVSGSTTNDGLIAIGDTEELAGPVGGAGSFSLNGASLQFNSSVSAGQTIDERFGVNALTLEQAQKFDATISGFGTGDTIDAANFHAPPATTFKFVENSAMTGGTLTLTDGSLTANIQLTGDYTNSDFTLAADSGTGTLVKFV